MNTAQGKQPKTCKSTIMRHLCERCSSLRVNDKSSRKVGTQRIIETVSEPSYENVETLAQSSRGSNGKACHLCALILRSLKGHQFIGTKEEDTCLPTGPISLGLTEESGPSLIAMCGDVVGYPIQLSLGMG